jgi:glutamate-1-semialdehyde 2,1-aminomutase
MEMIRFVNSGTEAGMSVVRLARAFTGRDLIVKFNGCYHGHADSLLVKAGSGVATYGLPDSPGVIKGAAEATISVPYNNIDIVADVFDRYGDKIAAVILEPVVGNSGLIIPISGFLESLRAVTAKFGSLLIFDEVMTGFRVHKGGAQALYGVVPDLTMLGKVIGGGLPVGAFGGRAEIMQMLAPIGPVYQAGTLSGNPLAMVAGRVTLEEWCLNGGFEVASKALSVLIENFRQIARENGVMLQVESIGSMFGYFFASEAVRCFEDAIRLSDKEMFRNFYLAVLERGVFFAPSPFEAGFISSEHNEAVLDETVSALKLALKSVADIYGSNK